MPIPILNTIFPSLFFQLSRWRRRSRLHHRRRPFRCRCRRWKRRRLRRGGGPLHRRHRCRRFRRKGKRRTRIASPSSRPKGLDCRRRRRRRRRSRRRRRVSSSLSSSSSSLSTTKKRRKAVFCPLCYNFEYAPFCAIVFLPFWKIVINLCSYLYYTFITICVYFVRTKSYLEWPANIQYC